MDHLKNWNNTVTYKRNDKNLSAVVPLIIKAFEQFAVHPAWHVAEPLATEPQPVVEVEQKPEPVAEPLAEPAVEKPAVAVEPAVEKPAVAVAVAVVEEEEEPNYQDYNDDDTSEDIYMTMDESISVMTVEDRTKEELEQVGCYSYDQTKCDKCRKKIAMSIEKRGVLNENGVRIIKDVSYFDLHCTRCKQQKYLEYKARKTNDIKLNKLDEDIKNKKSKALNVEKKISDLMKLQNIRESQPKTADFKRDIIENVTKTGSTFNLNLIIK